MYKVLTMVSGLYLRWEPLHWMRWCAYSVSNRAGPPTFLFFFLRWGCNSRESLHTPRKRAHSSGKWVRTQEKSLCKWEGSLHMQENMAYFGFEPWPTRWELPTRVRSRPPTWKSADHNTQSNTNFYSLHIWFTNNQLVIKYRLLEVSIEELLHLILSL